MDAEDDNDLDNYIQGLMLYAGFAVVMAVGVIITGILICLSRYVWYGMVYFLSSSDVQRYVRTYIDTLIHIYIDIHIHASY